MIEASKRKDEIMRCASRVVASLLLAALWLMVWSPGAWAIANFHPTKKELASLPDYCGPRATKWGNDLRLPAVKKWTRKFGADDWMHMHHWCEALVQIQRAAATGITETERRFHLKVALNNLGYSMRHATPSFVLWPAMLVKKAEISEALGGDENAAMAYIEALRRFPCYKTAYEGLASYYERHDEHAEAVRLRGFAKQARAACKGNANVGK